MIGMRKKKFLALIMTAILFVGLFNNADNVFAAEKLNNEPTLAWEEVKDFTLPGVSTAPVEEAEELNFDDDETVRVIIVFDENSASEAGYDISKISEDNDALKYSEKLEKGQNEVIEQIEDEVMEGDKLDTRYSFTLLANAVSADVRFGDIEAIESVEGVSAVYVTPVYSIEAEDVEDIYSSEMVGSYKTWNFGYTGAGMKIAIIDTGLDSDHPSYDEGAYLYSLQEQADKKGVKVDDFNLFKKEDIEKVVGSLNAQSFYKKNGELTADMVYRSAKIPYGFNYVDRSLDITHDNDMQGDHGSHVAGIAAANKYVPGENGLYCRQKNGVSGMAPDAQLFIMKVFGAAGGAYADDYMAALEDAIMLGVDTVNMSLGSSTPGYSKSADAYFQGIMESLTKYDTILTSSASNNGAWTDYSVTKKGYAEDIITGTNGSPGSFKNSFSSASAINTGYEAPCFIVGEDYIVSYDYGYLEDTRYHNRAFVTLTGSDPKKEYEYVFLPSTGIESDYEGLDVTGKIVFVSRGSISFYEKHTIAEKMGAAACVVYNNQSGKIGLNLTGTEATIPCVSIELSIGETIKSMSDYDEATGTYTGRLTVYSIDIKNSNIAEAYLISDFSSWGVPGSLTLKPEITSPGQYIYSTLDNGKYGSMDGTSMAAPCTNGLSALTLQYINENNLAEGTGLTKRALAISLLMSTATPLTDEDGILYSPRKQGSGLANVEGATTSKGYILVGDTENNDGKVKAELGDDPNRTGEFAFDFTIRNISDSTIYYDLGSIIMTESNANGFVAGQGRYLEAKASFNAENEQLVYDINGDGRVNTDDVRAFLKYINQSKTSEIISTCAEFYDIDNNGTVDTNDVRSLYSILLHKGGEKIDLGRKVVAVNKETKINVNIKLTDADKAYIDSNFVNGMYVEGFITLDGKVDLSIPVLAFYGNWTDASMFEAFDIMEYAKTGSSFSYTGFGPTNYLSYRMANSTKTSYFISNMYAREVDDEYIEDRNAISSLSGDSIASVTYSLLRNGRVSGIVKDAETGEIYLKTETAERYTPYFYKKEAVWKNTSATENLNWYVTDAEGNPLPEGTRVLVGVQALPEYYDDETKIPGEGVNLTFPMVVDNTAPTASFDALSRINNAGTLTVHDNRYTAAVYVFDSTQKNILAAYNVNQMEADTDVSLQIISPDDVYYVAVIDYAGNVRAYRANFSGQPDTMTCSSIELDTTSAELLIGKSIQLSAKVGPVTLLDSRVIWSSSDESIATVTQEGVVAAIGVGEAIITATTVALGENKEPLTAECNITVKQIDIDINAIVWDEEGKVYFTEFSTAKLPEYTVISGEMSERFWSAAVLGNTLYAAAKADTNPYGKLYKVDTETFEATVVDEKSVWLSDMAAGKYTDLLIGTVMNYIAIYDNDTSLGVIDVSNKLEGKNVVGITYYYSSYAVEDNNYVLYDYFLLIDDLGRIILLRVGLNLGTGKIILAYGDLGNCGVKTNNVPYYQSLFYDKEHDCLLYSNYDDDDIVSIYAISRDENNKYTIAEELGSFNETVWPVSGLFHMPVTSDNEAPDFTAEPEVLFAEVEMQDETADFISTEEIVIDYSGVMLTEKANAIDNNDEPVAPVAEEAPAPEEEEVTTPSEEEAPTPEEEKVTTPSEEETPAPEKEENTAPETPSEDEPGEEVTEPVEEIKKDVTQPSEPVKQEEPFQVPEPEKDKEEEGGIIGFFKFIGSLFKRRNN